uniref:Uncharacterized protein n=1 Tax=Globodera rostochiensis TaxID=31243 RepID=A0A914I4X6_GLORO
MFRRAKKDKEKKRSDATTNFHQTETENDRSTTGLYQIDTTDFRHGVQHLIAEPAFIPKDNSWSSESQMPVPTSHNFNQPQSDQSSSWHNDNSDTNDGLLGSITKFFVPK